MHRTLRKSLQVIKIFFLFSLITSCSLDYFEQGNDSSSSPELVFYDADFSRIDNNAVAIMMSVEQVEQYTEGGLTFAKAPSFTLYDSEENISTVGFCDVLAADTVKDEYTFFGNVSIISYEHDAKVQAENLRWSGETEIFSGAVGDSVSISVGSNNSETVSQETEKKTELYVEGEGFSASGRDFSFTFDGPVSGRIIEN